MPDDLPQQIEFRQSPIHGTGAFALTELPADLRLIEYVGDKISKAESARRCELNNTFIFTLDETWDLDGDVPWNPARHINHSCTPNCDAELEDGRIWIVSRRTIAPGEEITFNYGYDLEWLDEFPCKCGSPDCVGFMVAEELFPEVRRRLQAQLDRKHQPLPGIPGIDHRSWISGGTSGGSSNDSSARS
jgi:SET domain-containing protein